MPYNKSPGLAFLSTSASESVLDSGFVADIFNFGMDMLRVGNDGCFL